MKQKWRNIFHFQRNRNVDFKHGTIRHSWPFRQNYQKEKWQLKETGLIKRYLGSSWKKIIDEEKECFILEHLAHHPF